MILAKPQFLSRLNLKVGKTNLLLLVLLGLLMWWANH